MKANLLMEFIVNLDNRKVKVDREFAAPLEKVWAAWTRKELLDQWWAPKPWKAVTKSLDFRPGGRWIYAMKGPDNEVHWSCADFISIQNRKSFTATDAFCDEEGRINKDFPQARWSIYFSPHGDSTIVSIEIGYDAVADLQKYIEMGFKEGFTAAMENLDDLFDSGRI